MALPTPNLDNRKFQEVVDEAKRLIPRYCPEWTDHNVSDPGVALIELFAWMTEMLLYRVNQVPDKNYIKFLELIGIQRKPPRPATGKVTFYLSAPAATEIEISADTEVATVRTETSQAVIFTTEAPLPIRPAVIFEKDGAYTRTANRVWIKHDLQAMTLLNRKIAIFSAQPAPGDAFYIALERDHSNHVLALVMDCETAGGAGINPKDPPIEWQVSQSHPDRWTKCELEHDFTRGFSESGEVVLHVPPTEPSTQEILGSKVRAYWLRCRVLESKSGQGQFKVSPDIEAMRAESRGGTATVRHAITVKDEVLGYSDGTPGQSFRLLNTPVLSLNPETDGLIVQPPTSPAERWQEVKDFADSKEVDGHFTLDHLEGTLTLGPTLLQPNGEAYRFGAVPPKGSLLRFSRYQYGGGVSGNLSKDSLVVLKSSIPYVARVTNRKPTLGGLDAETVELAKLRAPQELRTRTRAVTADDFEHLTLEDGQVARACCIAPGAQPGSPTDPKPGRVFVVILPRVSNPLDIKATDLVPAADLRAAVLANLTERNLIGVTVDLQQPQFAWVSVKATVHVAQNSGPELREDVRERAEQALYQYLNPYIGGPKGNGWPFGRDLYLTELSALLQRVPAIEFVEGVQIELSEGGNLAVTKPFTQPRLQLPKSGLICSGKHTVTVK